MSERARTLIETWARAWSTRDAELMLSLFTEDCVYEDVATGTVSRGKQELSAFIQRGLTTMPDVVMAPSRIVVDEAGGAAEWVMTGTHTGDYPGLPATGNAVRSRGMSVFEVEGDALRRVSDYWDLASSGFVAGS